MTGDGDWHRWDGTDLVLQLQIQPRSSKTGFGDIHNDRLKLYLTAPPVEGKANQMLTDFLAKAFGLPRSAVTIARGETGRLKTVILADPVKLPATLDIPKKR